MFQDGIEVFNKNNKTDPYFIIFENIMGINNSVDEDIHKECTNNAITYNKYDISIFVNSDSYLTQLNNYL